MFAPGVVSVSVTVCPAGVWLYEPGTGQKTGVAAAAGGGVGGGGATEDVPPPQPMATSANANVENQL